MGGLGGEGNRGFFKGVFEGIFEGNFVDIFVIGHTIMAGDYLTKCCDLLISQSLMYVGDRQSLGILKAASNMIQK